MTQHENFTSISSTEILNQFNLKLSLFEDKRVWAIGGGKGGVGKSFLCANIAIELAAMGSKVIAIDLDLGGANLHTCLGQKIPEHTLSDYFSKKVLTIKEILTPTDHENLSLISGAQDELAIANLKVSNKNNFLSDLQNLDTDYIIFDLGAGTSLNTLDFFISADVGILATLPEPTSIENTYRFLKSCFFRKIQLNENFYKISHLLKKVSQGKITNISMSPVEVMEEIKAIDINIYNELKLELDKINYYLVMNQVRSFSEEKLGYSIEKICKKYFGFPVSYLGQVSYDPAVWQSIRVKKSLLQRYPNANSAGEVKELVSKLCQKELS